MKRNIENPTSFFFSQAANPTQEYRPQIDLLVSTLIDMKKCVLCKQDYTLTDRIPRILIHCGHTFCTPCLKNFYRNMRIRCPLCLKLVKNIEFLERLPVNHTIFTKIADELNEKNKLQGIVEAIDSQTTLYQQFAAVQNAKVPGDEQGLDAPIDGKDDDTGLENNSKQTNGVKNKNGDADGDYKVCKLHPDRLKHFFCLTEKYTLCRVCAENNHVKDTCIVVDLYEVEDIRDILQEGEENENDINRDDLIPGMDSGMDDDDKEEEDEDEDFNYEGESDKTV